MSKSWPAFIFCLTLLACSAFQYRYYGIAPSSYGGTLLGLTPTDDIPFATCSPTPQDQGKCVLLLREEFFKLKSDYSDLQIKLKACQAGQP